MGGDPTSWTVQDVGRWLDESGFSSVKPLFLDHDIDGDVLLKWITSDALETEIGIRSLGMRFKISKAIEALKKGVEMRPARMEALTGGMTCDTSAHSTEKMVESSVGVSTSPSLRLGSTVSPACEVVVERSWVTEQSVAGDSRTGSVDGMNVDGQNAGAVAPVQEVFARPRLKEQPAAGVAELDTMGRMNVDKQNAGAAPPIREVFERSRLKNLSGGSERALPNSSSSTGRDGVGGVKSALTIKDGLSAPFVDPSTPPSSSPVLAKDSIPSAITKHGQETRYDPSSLLRKREGENTQRQPGGPRSSPLEASVTYQALGPRLVFQKSDGSNSQAHASSSPSSHTVITKSLVSKGQASECTTMDANRHMSPVSKAPLVAVSKTQPPVSRTSSVNSFTRKEPLPKAATAATQYDHNISSSRTLPSKGDGIPVSTASIRNSPQIPRSVPSPPSPIEILSSSGSETDWNPLDKKMRGGKECKDLLKKRKRVIESSSEEDEIGRNGSASLKSRGRDLRHGSLNSNTRAPEASAERTDQGIVRQPRPLAAPFSSSQPHKESSERIVSRPLEERSFPSPNPRPPPREVVSAPIPRLPNGTGKNVTPPHRPIVSALATTRPSTANSRPVAKLTSDRVMQNGQFYSSLPPSPKPPPPAGPSSGVNHPFREDGSSKKRLTAPPAVIPVSALLKADVTPARSEETLGFSGRGRGRGGGLGRGRGSNEGLAWSVGSVEGNGVGRGRGGGRGGGGGEGWASEDVTFFGRGRGNGRGRGRGDAMPGYLQRPTASAAGQSLGGPSQTSYSSFAGQWSGPPSLSSHTSASRPLHKSWRAPPTVSKMSHNALGSSRLDEVGNEPSRLMGSASHHHSREEPSSSSYTYSGFGRNGFGKKRGR
ncbi:hypothetical protein HDU67_002874 [Dinochytrium kinnereticum]|nr:hypothetical protein HDU67_002874 [Dinochytrium kinnereticum]